MTSIPIDIILLMLVCMGGFGMFAMTAYLIILQLGRPTKVGRRTLS
jgi:hypothetical protein